MSRALVGLLVAGFAAVGGCTRERPAADPVAKSPAETRSLRRAFDGAPPVVPHDDFGIRCTECHNEVGRQVEGVGYSPPSPHERTAGMGELIRCRQCHVRVRTSEVWRESSFSGRPQDLRSGSRAFPGAPPVAPHAFFMRENCLACHSGPAAREEIRTSHPERPRCVQCHVERRAGDAFTAATLDRGGSS